MAPIYVKSRNVYAFALKLETIYEKLQFEALRMLGPNLKEMSKYEPNILIFNLRPCKDASARPRLLSRERAGSILHVHNGP